MTQPSNAPLPTLGDLRVQIDSLDQQLLSLLNQRAHVAEQVGEVVGVDAYQFAEFLF